MLSAHCPLIDGEGAELRRRHHPGFALLFGRCQLSKKHLWQKAEREQLGNTGAGAGEQATRHDLLPSVRGALEMFGEGLGGAISRRGYS